MDLSLSLSPHLAAPFGKLGGLNVIEPSTGGDEPIAEGLRNDDPAAFGALWREYGDGVFAVAMQRLRDRPAAEDVRQQVFVELWERRRTYDPARGSVRAWVMTVAHSRTIDHLRRRRPVSDDPDQVERLQADAGAQPQADRIVDRVGVAELLKRIPAQEAGLLRMRFYDELSQREIAERTGIPLGTVKMRMVTALERLRELLESDGVRDG